MFDITNIEVTDADILEIEGFFGFQLNEGQIKLLKFWESVDIQACPGSGKTTTLAAKLIILAKKIPASFQHGICVITHTNTAVEEIKEKLGPYAAFYSRYPNHFGTIQSFVDKFLTIPRFKQEYKHTPRIIDAEAYRNEIAKNFGLVRTGTLNFLDMNNVDVAYLSFNKFDFEVSKRINIQEPFSVQRISPDKMKVHYDRVVVAKKTLLSDGYVKYDEAYSLGFKYLRENPELKEIFSTRFPLVFIDEMQDMELHQSEIINTLFGDDRVSLQKIGDVNQSIFSRAESDDAADWKPVVNTELQLKNSNRIADNIVQVVRGICTSPQEMKGWENANPIKPVIIVYQNSSIALVKDKFAELIIRNNVPRDGAFKCVGSRIGDSRLNTNHIGKNSIG